MMESFGRYVDGNLNYCGQNRPLSLVLEAVMMMINGRLKELQFSLHLALRAWLKKLKTLR
jgi:hypothetical protein